MARYETADFVSWRIFETKTIALSALHRPLPGSDSGVAGFACGQSGSVGLSGLSVRGCETNPFR